jgi:hypothetical protein
VFPGGLFFPQQLAHAYQFILNGSPSQSNPFPRQDCPLVHPKGAAQVGSTPIRLFLQLHQRTTTL